MKAVSAAEFAENIEHWMADVEFANEAMVVTAPGGRQIVVIPGHWWCPAVDSPPEPSPEAGPSEWNL
ncbi:hypothetical protein [Roseomonas genomospecies 6]|nr:hypothetical protein [Roseomonas genomospecies 6]